VYKHLIKKERERERERDREGVSKPSLGGGLIKKNVTYLKLF